MTFIDSGSRTDETARLPFVYPKEFYVKYKSLPDGSQEAQDWVIVARKGQQNPTETPLRMKDLLKNINDPLTQVIKPHYDRWKENQAAPIIGVALESWIADAGLVKVLNGVGIRSVEDFVQLEDHLMQKLNIPNLRETKRRAQAFIEAQKGTAKVSQEISVLRGENEGLKREIAELKALIEAHAIKRGPGRPRKVVAPPTPEQAA